MNIFVLYAFCAGCYLVLAGTLELLFRERAGRFWLTLFGHRLLPLYGLSLTVTALPLTGYSGYFSSFIFITGAAVSLMGPFVLLFPGVFHKASAEMTQVESDGPTAIQGMVTLDSALRIALGSVFMTGSLLTHFGI